MIKKTRNRHVSWFVKLSQTLAQELMCQEIRGSTLFTAAGTVPPKEQSFGLGLLADCLVNLTLLDSQQFSELLNIPSKCSFLLH